MIRQRKQAIKTMLVLFSGLSANQVFSGDMGMLESSPQYVASISAGPVWQSGGTIHVFYLTPTIEKAYVENTGSSTLADGEVFWGIQNRLGRQTFGQFGVAVAATSNTTISGVIWDDTFPEFNNYLFSYKLQHAHVALKGKLLGDWGFFVSPWVSASVGIGFNRSYKFNNTPIIPEAVVNPNFTSSTKGALTYTLGLGIQKPLSTNWQVGVGYEFADWGKSELNRAMTQSLNGGLAQNHLYTNGVLFNITYLA